MRYLTPIGSEVRTEKTKKCLNRRGGRFPTGGSTVKGWRGLAPFGRKDGLPVQIAWFSDVG